MLNPGHARGRVDMFPFRGQRLFPELAGKHGEVRDIAGHTALSTVVAMPARQPDKTPYGDVTLRPSPRKERPSLG